MNTKSSTAIPVLLGILIGMGWLMTSVTLLRTLGAI